MRVAADAGAMEQVKLLSPDETRIKVTGVTTAQRYLDVGFTIIEMFGGEELDEDSGEAPGDEMPDSPATGEDQDEPTDETEEV